MRLTSIALPLTIVFCGLLSTVASSQLQQPSFAASSNLSDSSDAPLPMPKSTREQAAASAVKPSVAEIAPAASSAPHTPVIEGPELSSDKGFSTEDFLPPVKVKAGSRRVAKIEKSGEADDRIFVRVQLTVPHSLNAVHNIVAYPYPVALPKVRKEVKDLATDTPQLKSSILSTGYTQRAATIKPYPFLGWRWQYAYHNALHRAHIDEPAVIADIYPFVSRMLPYCREESKRVNTTEHERVERYKRLGEQYEQERSDLEQASVRKGYEPVRVNINKLWRGHFNVGEIKLGEGTWWITGIKKVPGLVYYWQQPVEVVKGEPVICELTEDNALVIEGGW